jgi:histidine triad (HIT) family protein
MASVFSKIIAGEIPCYKIYEDERVFAFLDINPIQQGHVLVVPKKEVDQFTDLDDENYIAVMLAAKKIAQAQKKALDCTRVCTIVEGYQVPHFHYHLIPTNSEKDFTLEHKTVDPKTMESLARLIVENL